MLVKILGLIDIISVLVLVLSKIMPHKVTLFFAMLLCMKGFLFLMMRNTVSIIDLAAGVYIGLGVYGFSNVILTLFFAIYLGQKGLLSLIRI
jgi:predicted RND superfamily exporter protein